jgi:hypothetical protein
MKLKKLNKIIDYLHCIDIAFPQFLGRNTWDESLKFKNLRAEWENNPHDNKAVKVFSDEEYLGYVRKKYDGKPAYDDFLVETIFKFINAGIYYANYYFYDFDGRDGERVVGQKIRLYYFDHLDYIKGRNRLKRRERIREVLNG